MVAMSSDTDLQTHRSDDYPLPAVGPGTAEGVYRGSGGPSLVGGRPHRSRPLLYQPPDTRVCYFYSDSRRTFDDPGIKVVVNPRVYPTVDVLKEELNRRVDGLPFGVRNIYTPAGRHVVESVTDLRSDGHYVCTTLPTKRQRGFDIVRTDFGKNPAAGRTTWKPFVSGGGRGTGAVGSYANQKSRRTVYPRINYRRSIMDSSPRGVVPAGNRRQAWMTETEDLQQKSQWGGAAGTSRSAPKKIVVVRSVDAKQRQTLLLYRKTSQTFEQVLDDLSAMFQSPVAYMYTTEGHPVRSLSAIFSGPDVYIVTDGVDRLTSSNLNAITNELLVNGELRRPYVNGGNTAVGTNNNKRTKLAKTKGKWKVWVTTNELPSAGTQAQVSITVYGHRGNTGPLSLGTPNGEIFQAGNIDEFIISVGNIGEIYKIRISHDNTGEFPGWFCDEVRMQDLDTDEEMIFRCQRWLSVDEDDGDICREIPVTHNGITVLPLVTYEVVVTTSDLWNAGTGANAHVTLYGEMGDTGLRHLLHSRTPQTQFQAGQSDVFSLEAVSLGNVTRVVIGHDDSTAGKGWYVDRVMVRDISHSKLQWIFPCRRWMDEGEDDGKIVRDLKQATTTSEELYKAKLFDSEKWKLENGCQVSLYSQTTHLPLRINLNGQVDACGEFKDDFAVFKVIQKKGAICSFRSVLNPNLHLAMDGRQLLGVGKGGSFSEFIVNVHEDRSVTLESVKFADQFVTIMQSGKPGSSSAEFGRIFYIHCKGAMRDQGIIMLCTSMTQALSSEKQTALTATGRHDKLAHFRVHKVAPRVRMFESVLFPQQFIQLTEDVCNLKGTGDENCQFIVHPLKDKAYVMLESTVMNGMFIGMLSDGKVRPTVNTDDRNVRFYPEVVQYGISASAPLREMVPSPVPAKKLTPRKKKIEEPAAPAENFTVNDWKVFILSTESAVNADITLVAYGDEGSSGPIALGRSDNTLFQAGNVDEFKINLQNVGKVYKIRLEVSRQQPKNVEPSWKVKTVKLQNLVTKEVLKFHFDNWLSRQQADGQLVRELPAVRPNQEVPPVVAYYVHTYTGSQNGADTNANVYLTLFGEHGDSGKHLLHRSNNRSKFQPGQIDVFTLDAVSLGKLRCCVVAADSEAAGDGWFCDQIVVREGPNATHEYIFPCQRWLDSGVEDGKTERILKPQESLIRKPRQIRPSSTILPPASHDYRKMTMAMERRRAMATTMALPSPSPSASPSHRHFSIIVAGPSLHSAIRRSPIKTVKKAADPVKIESDVESEILEAIEPVEERLPPIKTKPTRVRQTPRKVIPVPEPVKMESDSEMEITETEPFELEETVSAAKEKPKPGEWMVWTTTGSDDNMSTTAVVTLTAYGSNDVSEPIELGGRHDGNFFRPEATDEFKIDFGKDIGQLYKIRLEHIQGGLRNGWYLKKIVLKHLLSREWLTLEVNRWLSSYEDDFDVCREVAVSRPGKRPLPVLTYRVEVYTSDSTVSSIYVQIFGSHGDTGKRRLHRSRNNDTSCFQKAQMDEFDVEAVSLDEITKVVVSLDPENTGETWHCNNIMVREGADQSRRLFYFPCNQQLDSETDNEKTLWPTQPPAETPPVETPSVETPSVETPPAKELVTKPVQKPIKRAAENPAKNPPAKKMAEKPIVQADEPKEEIVYLLTVKTGDLPRAETSAGVYCRITGSDGETKQMELTKSRTRGPLFCRGQEDVFELKSTDVGKVSSITIGHDGVGRGRGWYLDSVRLLVGASENQLLFPCNRWFDTGCEDRKTERILFAIGELPVKSKPPTNIKSRGALKVGVTMAPPSASGSDTQHGNSNNNNSNIMEGDGYDDVVDNDENGEWKNWASFDDLNVNNNNGNNIDSDDDDDDDQHSDAWENPMLPDSLNFNSNNGNELPGDNELTTPTLCVYGSSGMAGPLELNVGSGNQLQADASAPAECNISVGDIGAIYKVRVCSEQRGDPHKSVWSIGELTLQDVHTKELLRFDFSRFIGEVGGDICKEMPAIKANENILQVITYKVIVETGDRNDIGASGSPGNQRQTAGNSGSAAVGISSDEGNSEPAVCVTLYGSRGDSGARQLFIKDDRTQKFQPGQINTFTLDAVDLGDLQKLAVSKLTGPAWHLKLIVVKSGPFAPKEHVFMHDRLLAEGSEPVHNELLLSETRKSDVVVPLEEVPGLPQSEGNWQVSMTTGDADDAWSDDAQVAVVLCGDLCESSLLPLITNDQPAFQRGKTTNFEIKIVEEVGELTKVRVGFVDRSRDQQWYLQKMQFEDIDTRDEFDIEVNDWIMCGAQGDGWREFPVVWPGLEPAPVFKYRVQTFTGSHKNSSTRANVYVNVFAEVGSTGKRRLEHSINNAVKFRVGQMDLFELESVELIGINKVIVGHDAKKPGAGWFLDKIIVYATTDRNKKYIFECNRWLDVGMDDRAIERTLHLPAPQQTTKPTKLPALPRPAPAPTKVTKGKSSPRKPLVKASPIAAPRSSSPVASKPKSPQPTDVWRVSLTSGVYKPEVAEDGARNTNNNANGLDSEDETDGAKQTKMSRWNRFQQYHVAPRPPTTGLVVVVYGDRGKTGILPLTSDQPLTEVNFKPGKPVDFKIKLSEDVGNIYKVRLGYSDDNTDSQNWLLDTMVLEDPKTLLEYTFELKDRLIRDAVFDGWKEIPVRMETDSMEEQQSSEVDSGVKNTLPVITYTADIFTANIPNAGTKANVYMMLVGERGDTGNRKLLNPTTSTSLLFQQGQTDTFEIDAVDLLGVTKVILGHDGVEEGQGWFVKKVVVRSELGSVWTFNCNRWLDSGKDDGLIERELTDIIPSPPLPRKPRTETVDQPYAEEKEEEKEELLEEVEESSPLPAEEEPKDDIWKVSVITGVHEPDDMEENEGNSNNNANGLDSEDEEDKKRKIYEKRRQLRQYRVAPRPPTASLVVVVYGDRGKTRILPLTSDRPLTEDSFKPGKPTEFKIRFSKDLGEIFKVRIGFKDDVKEEQNWLLDSMILQHPKTGRLYTFELKDRLLRDAEFDGWKEIPVKPEQNEEPVEGDKETLQKPVPVMTYKVDVYTGDLPNAGTAASVYMMLVGKRGDTGHRKLLKPVTPSTLPPFQEGLMDSFEIEAVDLQTVTKVIVGHDGVEEGQGWFVEKVVVCDETGMNWTFNCYRWLDAGEDDGLIERELYRTVEQRQEYLSSPLPTEEHSSAVPAPSSPKLDPDIWKVSVTTGVYEPELDDEVEQNSNNNARGIDSEDEEDAVRKKLAEKRRQLRQYRVAPRPPTAGLVVVVYGDRGKTGALPLTSDEPLTEDSFKPGQPVDFKVKFTKDVGKIYKVRLGFADDVHEKQNWLLDSVLLQDPRTDRLYTFELKDRLIRDEEFDGWREIPVKPEEDTESSEGTSKEPLPVITYRVDVYTGDLPKAGTTSNVYIMLVGKRGDTGHRKLLVPLKSAASSPFQPGQVDSFEIEAVDLQTVTKVIVGHDGVKKGQGWFVEKVVIHESLSSWTFNCNRWLDSGEEDGLIERILYRTVEPQQEYHSSPVVPAEDHRSPTPAPATPQPDIWKVSLTTGIYEPEDDEDENVDEENTNNNANGRDSDDEDEVNRRQKLKQKRKRFQQYRVAPRPPTTGLVVVVYGDQGKSEILPLTSDKPVTKDSFKPGQPADFQFRCSEDLGEIYKIHIGYSEDNMDDQNWLMDSMVIQDPKTGQLYTFELNDRLIRDKDFDGWKEIPVKPEESSSQQNDGSEETLKKRLPVITYTVDVYTGDLSDAGTRANVYMMLVGKRGDTGNRKLPMPITPSASPPFQLGQVDSFEIEAVDLRTVTKVIVGHDGLEEGQGWFLRKVVVRNETGSYWTFNCKRWLDSGKADGLIERELYRSVKPKQKPAEDQSSPAQSPEPDVWKVTLTSGVYEPDDDEDKDEQNTNNNANGLESEDEEDRKRKISEKRRKLRQYRVAPRPPTVGLVVVVYGDHGKTGILPLTSDQPLTEDSFKPGQPLDLKVKFSEDLGEIYKIRLGFSDENMDKQNWLLDSMAIQDPRTGRLYTFELKDRLIRDEEFDGWKEIPVKPEPVDEESPEDEEVQVDHTEKPLPVMTYTVDVYTGNLPNAGTTANVYMMLVGERGDTGNRKLLKPIKSTASVTFQQGQVDRFEIEAVDLLTITKVIAGHDGVEEGQGWLLRKVVVRNELGTSWTFKCNRWLDSGEDDGLIERELLETQKSPVADAAEPQSTPSSPPPGDIWKVSLTPGVYEPEENDEDENTNNNANGLDSEDEEDVKRKTLLDKQKKLKQYRVAPRPPTVGLVVVVYGDHGKTGILPLTSDEPLTEDSFKPGQPLDLKVQFSEDLGEIYKVRLGYSDDVGDDQNWLLDSMALQDPRTGHLYTFELKDRLIRDEEFDGWKEIPVKPEKDETEENVDNGESSETRPLPVIIYTIDVYTGNLPNAGTSANVYMMLVGERGDTGNRKLLKPVSSTGSTILQQGQVDSFEIEAVDLQTVTKVIVGHDGIEEGQGWFVRKVIVRNEAASSWTFSCNRWLDSGRDDGAIERELCDLAKEKAESKTADAAPEDEPPSSPPETWKVSLTSGDYEPQENEDGEQDNTNNNANGLDSEDEEDAKGKKLLDKRRKLRQYRVAPRPPTAGLVVVVYGDRGKTELLPLTSDQPLTEESFKPGQPVDFKVEISRDVGELYKVRMGYAEDVMEEQNWLLDAMVLEDPQTGRLYTFELKDRLIRDEEFDGWTEIPLKPEQNSQDNVQNTPENAENDGELKEPLPVITYIVDIYTGDLPNAGTTANVYMMLVGERGDTGNRKLLKPIVSTEFGPFQQGQVDSFEIGAVDLQTVTKVIVGHDGVEEGQGWFIEKVVVHDDKDSNWTFNCNRWLDSGEDDGLIERELLPLSDVWKVSLTSGVYEPEEDEDDEEENTNNNANGLDSEDEEDVKRKKLVLEKRKKLQQYCVAPRPPTAGLVVVVYGDHGKTGILPLTSDEPLTEDSFKPGQPLDLKVKFSEDLGQIYKVRLGFSEENLEEQNWLLDSMAIQDPRTGRLYSFELQDRLIRDEEFDGWKEIPVKPEQNDEQSEKNGDAEKSLPVITYTIDIYTGNLPNAGTSANVYMMLVGERGDTGNRKLLKPVPQSSYPPFQLEQVDHFEIEAVDLLTVTKVIVGHDGVEEGQGWFIEKVVVHNDSASSWNFNCNRWLDSGEDDGLIERELLEAEAAAAVEAEAPSQQSASPSPDSEDVWKVSLTSGVYEPEEDEEDDKNTNNNANGRDSEDEEEASKSRKLKRKKLQQYRVAPRPPTTGLVVVVYGDGGKTGILPLTSDQPITEDSFKPGQPIDFQVKFSEKVGKIYKIRLGYSDDIMDEQNWLLDTMVLQDPKSGQLYTFELNDRLIRDEEFDGWQEVPVKPEKDESQDEKTEKPLPVITYFVDVYTGDLPNAGTTANAYVMLVGERGDTGNRKLLKPLATSTPPFQQGQMDSFEIEAVDLVTVTKVVIGHDGAEEGQGWFVEKVVVRCESQTPDKSTTFHCNRWLDSGEDDGLIERELEPGDIWKVSMTSGVYEPEEDEDGEAADENTNNNANGLDSEDEDDISKQKKLSEKRKNFQQYHVAPKPPTAGLVVVVYGDRGKTGILPLTSDQPLTEESFKPGQPVDFKVRFSEDIGEVYKVRLGFADDVSDEQNWLLDTMVIQDPKTLHLYTFELKDRLIRDNEFDGWKEVPVKPEADSEVTTQDENQQSDSISKELPVFMYTIDVYTGDLPNADTTANVYVMLVGERGDTGNRKLLKPVTPSFPLFQQGQMDSFEIEAVDLLTVTKVITGHDGIEEGQGWFVEKVIVRNELGSSWTFSCNRWLDVGEDDGLIERELIEQQQQVETDEAVADSKPDEADEAEETEAPKDTWKVVIVSGTYVPDSDVDEDAAGDDDEGNTNNNANGRESDAEDDDSKPTTKAEPKIVDKRKQAPKPPTCPLVLVVYGDKCKSRDLELVSEKENEEDLFQPGSASEFEVDIPEDVGNVYKVRIGFGNNPPDEEQNYLLDTITLQNPKTGDVYSFELKDRLIADDELDGWREIPVSKQDHKDADGKDSTAEQELLPVYTYKVEVCTGDLPNAETHAGVYLTLVGQRGDTGQRRLLKALSAGNNEKFSLNQMDVFEFEAVELLDIEKIIVGHDGAPEGEGWFLDKITVRVTDKDSPKKYLFPCGRWLDSGEDDGLIERVLDTRADVYKVTVTSGEPPEPSPDGENDAADGNTNNNANGRSDDEEEDALNPEPRPASRKRNLTPWPPTCEPVIVIYGDLGKTQELPLKVKEPVTKEPFQPGEPDEFEIRFCEDIGEVYKVRVGFSSDNADDQNWLLGALTVEEVHSGQLLTFELNDRLVRDAESDGWKEIPLKIEPAEPSVSADSDPAAEDSNKTKTGPGSSQDGQQVAATDSSDRAQQQQLSVYVYQVEVYTGSVPNAATDAGVYITLYGDRGDTGRRKLLKSTSTEMEEKFRPSQVDVFEIEAVDLLDIRKVVVGHDGKAAGEGWFLGKIIVRASHGDCPKKFTFLCDRWLDEAEDDGLIERELSPADMWVVAVTTGVYDPMSSALREAHLTDVGKKKLEVWKKHPKYFDPPHPPTRQLVIVVYGENGKTQTLPLTDLRPVTYDKFQPSYTDDFKINFSEDLGSIYKIRIGFDDELDCEENWLLDTVTLEEYHSGRNFTFTLNDRVMADEAFDGWKEIPVTVYTAEQSSEAQTAEERQLQASDTWCVSSGDTQQVAPQTVARKLPVYLYTVDLCTGIQSKSTSLQDVYIMLVGQRGDTGSRKLKKSLNSSTDKFQPGQIDSFEIEAVDLFEVTKVVVGHGGKGPENGSWFLDRVNVYSPAATQKDGLRMLTFDCQRWLDEAQDDGLTERELSTSQKPEGSWLVTVATNHAEAGGVVAHATLTVFGNTGKSASFPLGHPGIGLFQRSATDQFCINIDEAVIGQITKLRIEHDGKQPGVAWHLDKIVMEQQSADGDRLQFDVQRWLRVDDDDGDIVREVAAVAPDGAVQPSTTRYVVQVETGDSDESVFDVYVVLCGVNGDSGRRYLKKNKEGGVLFEMFKCDTFHIEAIGLGELQKLIVGYESGNAWNLDKITVREAEDAVEEYIFIRRPGEDDSNIWTELELVALKQPIQADADNSDTEPAAADGSKAT